MVSEDLSSKLVNLEGIKKAERLMANRSAELLG